MGVQMKKRHPEGRAVLGFNTGSLKIMCCLAKFLACLGVLAKRGSVQSGMLCTLRLSPEGNRARRLRTMHIVMWLHGWNVPPCLGEGPQDAPPLHL